MYATFERIYKRNHDTAKLQWAVNKGFITDEDMKQIIADNPEE